jgi:Trk K+ transport system NAD-binding subunit
VGLTMETAEQKYNMTIVMHRAGDHLHLHPQHDEIIHANDILVVFATLDTLGLISANNQSLSPAAGRDHGH